MKTPTQHLYFLVIIILSAIAVGGEAAPPEAYVMPKSLSDRTVYRIAFGDDVRIEPFCVVGAFSSSVSSLGISQDKETIQVFHERHLMLFKRASQESEIFSFDDILSFGEKVTCSSDGKYLLTECRGSTPGRQFAVIDAHNGRLIHLVKGVDSELNAACFNGLSGNIVFCEKARIYSLSHGYGTQNTQTWGIAPPPSWVFADVQSLDSSLLLCTVNTNENSRPMSVIEKVTQEGTPQEIARDMAGWPFNQNMAENLFGTYAYHTGEIVVHNIREQSTSKFKANRGEILNSFSNETAEFKLIETILKEQTPKDELVYFDYSCLVPGGQHAVFGLNTSSMRHKGIFLVYDLKEKRWKDAFIIGKDDAGGATWLAFPPR